MNYSDRNKNPPNEQLGLGVGLGTRCKDSLVIKDGVGEVGQGQVYDKMKKEIKYKL
jgi:hypothetical protein